VEGSASIEVPAASTIPFPVRRTESKADEGERIAA
jgi:hypothetical protein